MALFDCGIDAKLRGCDLVKLRVSAVAPGGLLRLRATVIQQKTGRPVPFEITDTRAKRSPRGSHSRGAAPTTGSPQAAAAQAITSARASTPASLAAGWP